MVCGDTRINNADMNVGRPLRNGPGLGQMHHCIPVAKIGPYRLCGHVAVLDHRTQDTVRFGIGNVRIRLDRLRGEALGLSQRDRLGQAHHVTTFAGLAQHGQRLYLLAQRQSRQRNRQVAAVCGIFILHDEVIGNGCYIACLRGAA